jgi:UDP-glucose 4-epimerase
MITGGTGFLGSHLTRHLVREKQRDDVVLFDSLPALERIADLTDEVTIVRGDILEIQSLIETMRRHDVQRVVHLAYLAGGEIAPGQAVPYVRVQCLGTTNVFEAARIQGVQRVVNASSVAVYGKARDGSLDETAAIYPDRPYASCKAWGEQLSETFNGWGMEIISLRVASSMGHGRLGRASLAQGLIEQRVNYMAAPELVALGRPALMPPDDQVCDFIHVRDTAEGFWCALTAARPPHHIYNLRSEQVPACEITSAIRAAVPDADMTVSPEPVWKLQLMDNTRLVQELDFRPRYDVRSAVAQYVEDVRSRA